MGLGLKSLNWQLSDASVVVFDGDKLTWRKVSLTEMFWPSQKEGSKGRKLKLKVPFLYCIFCIIRFKLLDIGLIVIQEVEGGSSVPSRGHASYR